jgi:hypothetical protein
LTVGEGSRFDLFELPPERAQRALWRPFAAGAVGVLVLTPADGVGLLVQDLSAALGVPVVVCGPSREGIPEAVREARGGVAFGGSDPAEALRALLAGAGLRRAAA